MTGQITYKKGWLRCKHGILLKRGKTVVGHCLDCSFQWFKEERPELYAAAREIANENAIATPDQGVT